MTAPIASIIARAISSGFNAKSILSHLIRQYPQYATAIHNVSALGYTADKILKHLMGEKGRSADDDSYLTDSEKTDKSDKQKKRKAAIGLGIAGLAAAGGAAGLAGFASRNAAIYPSQILPALPQQNQLPAPPAQLQLPNTSPNTPPTPNPSPSPMQATPGQVIGAQNNTPIPSNEVAQAAQAIPNQPPQIDSESIINQMGIADKILNLQNAGNSPEQISAAIEAFGMTPEQKKWLKQQTQVPFSEIVKDYVQKNPNKAKETPKNDQIQQENDITQPISEEIEEIKPKKIEKGSEVLTPNGFGTVKGEDSKGFIVESEGKASKIPYQEAISSPLLEKDMADLYTDLVNKIPESARSSMINVAGYDPDVNEFIFMPHDGALYVYKDIPQEFADKLKGALFQAKTTGSNFYGAWAKGEESRGAGLSALIKELQKLYGGKGKEYIRKYEKVYDFFSLPKAAVKEREKKEREERKQKKSGKK